MATFSEYCFYTNRAPWRPRVYASLGHPERVGVRLKMEVLVQRLKTFSRLNGLRRSAVLIFFAALIPLKISACSYYFGVGIFFENNSAVIDVAQMNKLAAWAEKTRKYQGDNSLDLDVTVEKSESDPVSLGRRRELAVWLALIDLHMTPWAKIHPSNHIEVIPPGYGMKGGGDVKRVEISYFPDQTKYHLGNCATPVEK